MSTSPDERAQLMPVMQAAEIKMVKEIEAEQITNPIDLYQPGSERLERLYAAMELAHRFEWPSQLEFNV